MHILFPFGAIKAGHDSIRLYLLSFSASRSCPNCETVICWHRVQTLALHPPTLTQFIERLDISNTHVVVSLSQRGIEVRITLGTKLAALPEGSVQAKNTSFLKRRAHQREHLQHCFKTHDVCRVRRIHRVIGFWRNLCG